MSRIEIKHGASANPPAPKQTLRPGAPSSAHFTPAPQRPAAPPAGAGHTRFSRQPARSAKQARATDEAPQGRVREGAAPDMAGASGTGLGGVTGLPVRNFIATSGETPDDIAGSAGSGEAAALAEAASDDTLDCAALAALLPRGKNDGIFDVMLPNGERMGVVVSGKSSSLSYLLSPATEKLGSRLRRQRMELEQRVERLTQRNVNITVL